ncbi:MAG: helix-turn-helix domain-containing protein [Ktedonobacteraceae bacterium]|nr:helix-turn-helix domain-containing protein [Ktedonobacteraceae bacterium]
MSKWLTTAEAGKLVGRSARHIATLAKTGRIAGRRWGATWMINRDSLEDFFRAPPRRGPKGPIIHQDR